MKICRYMIKISTMQLKSLLKHKEIVSTIIAWLYEIVI